MPKLDGTHIADRLRERLEELREGKEVAARDLRALLTEEQVAVMDAAWAEQQTIRKQKRARTKEEEVALGWKTKRDIQIAAYEQAIAESDAGVIETFEKLKRKSEVRQARIYMDSYFKAIDEGKQKQVAENLANNDLTRAGLPRMDAKIRRIEGVKIQRQIEKERAFLERVSKRLNERKLED